MAPPRKASVFDKPFTWSYSKLKNFEVCPHRHEQIDLLKNITEPESEELKWGNFLHDALAAAIGTDDNDKRDPRDQIKPAPLPEALTEYQLEVDMVAGYRARNFKVYTELALAIDNQFMPCPWFDARGTPPRAWYRAKVDALAIHPGGIAYAWDWKTGKPKEDDAQLAMTALLCFVHYPEIKSVVTSFVWLKEGHDVESEKEYRRDDMATIWNDIYPRVVRLANAFESRSYPMNPGGLCKSWCPVRTCPHNGKRN